MPTNTAVYRTDQVGSLLRPAALLDARDAFRAGTITREALAAATNNYALQFGWTELGQVAPGRRADILVVDADPTASIWNARRISLLIVDGEVVDRDALLTPKR